MTQAISAYRHVVATDEFKEIERLRSRPRHNEASALENARREGEEAEREKWLDIVADKDAVLADKVSLFQKPGHLLIKPWLFLSNSLCYTAYKYYIGHCSFDNSINSNYSICCNDNIIQIR